MTHPNTAPTSARLTAIGPALLGATSFACADVLTKVTLRSGADVLTVSVARGAVGIVVLLAWLRLVQSPGRVSVRERWISLALGLVFGANVFLVFTAIDLVGVPIAILTYFVYPLLTGFAAAATGLDKLTWRGIAAALVAFVGLGLMIGAHPGTLAIAGIVAALAGASCRVVLLLATRALLQGTDARMITWYSLLSSTVMFALAALFTMNWQPPATPSGWIALAALGVAIMAGILGVFASTARIGPFRTALLMNLEPLLATIGSAVFLSETITPLQSVGALVMIAALVSFQLRR